MRLLLALLCAAGYSCAATTLIQDTIQNADGTTFNGTLYVSWPTFYSGSQLVVAGSKTVAVKNGVVSTDLYPSDNSNPAGAIYTVRYATGDGSYIEYWQVPTSATPVTIADCRNLNPSTFPFLPVTDLSSYDFAPRKPGVTLSAGSPSSVILKSCPLGVAVGNYLYISGGVGTPEPILITAMTGTSPSASCSISFTPLNAHSGSYVVGSASEGMQEKLTADAASPSMVWIPAGQFTIHGPIRVPPPTAINNNFGSNWTISGAGREATFLNVASDFPLLASGLFVASYTAGSGLGPQPGQQYGPVFQDFHVVFPQPYSGGRAGLIHWPPAINGSGVNYGVVKDITIDGAWDGIKVVGDSGGVPFNSGWLFDDIWMAAYDIGINLDGSADITRIHGFHFWPFGAPAGFDGQGMMFDPACIGLKAGRLDGLYVSDSFFLSGTAVDFEVGADGGITNLAHFVNTDFDVFGSVLVNTAEVSFDNVNFFLDQSPGSGPYSCGSAAGIQYTSGSVSVNNAMFYRSCAGFPDIRIAPAGLQSTNFTFAQFSVTNSKFYDSTNTASASSTIQIVGNNLSAATQVTLSGNQFVYTPALNYSNPAIALTGDSNLSLSFTHNTGNNLGGGSGKLLSLGFDNFHVVQDNVINQGWSIALPSTMLLGVYEDTNFQYQRGTYIGTFTAGTHSATGYSGTFVGDSTSGQVQFNLPFLTTAAKNANGADYVFIKSDGSANHVLLVPAGTDTIEGAANLSLTTQWQTIRLHGLNGVWYKE